jgi:hypothetical protein
VRQSEALSVFLHDGKGSHGEKGRDGNANYIVHDNSRRKHATHSREQKYICSVARIAAASGGSFILDHLQTRVILNSHPREVCASDVGAA